MLPSGSPRSSPPRLLAAALLFAVLYLLWFPCILLSCVAVLAWETLRWLMLSVFFVPALTVIGFWGLLPGLPLIALLIGATAVRWPDRIWIRLVPALLLPLVELFLIRGSGLPHLAGRMLPMLIDRSTLFLLGTAAPVLSSGLSALLIPAGLMRRILRTDRVRMHGDARVQRLDR